MSSAALLAVVIKTESRLVIPQDVSDQTTECSVRYVLLWELWPSRWFGVDPLRSSGSRTDLIRSQGRCLAVGIVLRHCTWTDGFG